LTIFGQPSREQRSGIVPNLFAAGVLAAGFCWRLWLAHATFLNTDEAWHLSVANQNSLMEAYRASLTLAHPPLLVFVLYFWKYLGSSDLFLRLPGVLAGTIFCWVFYKWLALLFGRAAAWCALIFAAFLPPMIVLSAELRQYSWMLLFAVSAAYLLERACSENSWLAMLLSSLCLWLAMLSHYSAFLFAGALGIYAIVRVSAQRPAKAVIGIWAGGQTIGVALAAFLFTSHITKLGAVYPGAPLRRFGDFYLADVYFHPGKETLLHFLYRGTFGIFRFICAQRTAGHLTTVLFVVGLVLLLWKGETLQAIGSKGSGPQENASQNGESSSFPRSRNLALLLLLPFFLNWIAVIAGFYPYGRTRQCVFLAIFGIAGVSYCLARIAGNRTVWAAALAVAIMAMCHIFGTPHSLDMIVSAEQRHEHMDAAIAFIRSSLASADVLFTDKPTSFQLMHYLCGPRPVSIHSSGDGFDSFDCEGIRVISTTLDDGSLTARSVPGKLRAMESSYPPNFARTIWVMQAAWSDGLGEELRREGGHPYGIEFSQIEPHVFDRYIEVFKLPPPLPILSAVPQAR
jgi:hypothetical protein